MMRFAVPALAALLVTSALALVTSQYRTRELFARIELARQETRNLTADETQLRVQLGQASQPAVVAAAAERLGMRPITPADIALLPVLSPGSSPGSSPYRGAVRSGGAR